MSKPTRTTTGWTIGQLARTVGLTRSTLLYYHRVGLLPPTGRSAAGYRLYTQADRERLEQICFFRRMGIPLADIAGLVRQSESAGETGRILQRRLRALETEIETLQEQQRQIVHLLEQLSLQRSHLSGVHRRSPRARGIGAGQSHKENNTMVNKKRWVEIMKAAGLSEQNMQAWHKSFEEMEPQAHQEFLDPQVA